MKGRDLNSHAGGRTNDSGSSGCCCLRCTTNRRSNYRGCCNELGWILVGTDVNVMENGRIVRDHCERLSCFCEAEGDAQGVLEGDAGGHKCVRCCAIRPLKRPGYDNRSKPKSLLVGP